MAISASFSDMVVMHEFMNTTRRRLQPGTRIQQYSFCQFFEQFKIRSQSYPPFRVMCVCVCRCVDPIRRSVGCNCFYFSGPSRHNCMIFFHKNRFLLTSNDRPVTNNRLKDFMYFMYQYELLPQYNLCPSICY